MQGARQPLSFGSAVHSQPFSADLGATVKSLVHINQIVVAKVLMASAPVRQSCKLLHRHAQ